MTSPPFATRVFAKETRSLTMGILLGITVVAFEALAVVTVAPLLAADLDGLDLYGWIFSGLLLASLVGAVVGGQLSDVGPLGRPLLGGLVFFALGLAVSGAAQTMLVLLAGRVLQGLGGGVLSTVLYAAITRAYPDNLRARMMALTSSAWIVPALLGPTLAGLVAEALHWRWVFWGILPLVAVMGVLMVRPFAALGAAAVAGEEGDEPAAARPSAAREVASRVRASLLLAVGTGLFLVGVGAERPWLVAALALVGAATAGQSLRMLLPAGTLGLRRGLPAVVASRGTLSAAFIGVEAFLALMLTSVHGFSTAVTGAVIATGALSWALGSWLQSRHDENHADKRELRLVAGTTLLTLGIATQAVTLLVGHPPLAIVVAGWVVAGLGIGIAHSTSSVLAFALAPPREVGSVSAALQIGDQFGSALSTGVGGALLALATRTGWGQKNGLVLAFAFVLVLAVVAVTAAWRSRR